MRKNINNSSKKLLQLFFQIILIVIIISKVPFAWINYANLKFNIILKYFIMSSLIGLISYIIDSKLINNNDVNFKQKHDLTKNMFIETSYIPRFLELYLFFPMTIFTEEIVFRAGIFQILINYKVPIPILINAFIFAIYHIHIYFTFKNLRITFAFMFSSFLLGILCGLVFIDLGLFFAILIHWFFAFFLLISL